MDVMEADPRAAAPPVGIGIVAHAVLGVGAAWVGVDLRGGRAADRLVPAGRGVSRPEREVLAWALGVGRSRSPRWIGLPGTSARRDAQRARV